MKRAVPDFGPLPAWMMGNQINTANPNIPMPLPPGATPLASGTWDDLITEKNVHRIMMANTPQEDVGPTEDPLAPFQREMQEKAAEMDKSAKAVQDGVEAMAFLLGEAQKGTIDTIAERALLKVMGEVSGAVDRLTLARYRSTLYLGAICIMSAFILGILAGLLIADLTEPRVTRIMITPKDLPSLFHPHIPDEPSERGRT